MSHTNIKNNNSQILAILDDSEVMSTPDTPTLICLNPRTDVQAPPTDSQEQIQEVSEVISDLEFNYELDDSNDDGIMEFIQPAKLAKRDHLGRGKKLAPCWQEFRHTNNTATKVVCRHCNTPVSKQAPRLRTHLKKCRSYQKPSVSGRESVPEVVAEFPISTLNRVDSGRISKGKTGQRKVTLTSYLDKMPKSEQQNLNMEIGRYIFAMNLPFAHVEHPAFTRLFGKLSPACTLPSRKTIGGTILTKTYDEVVKERSALINGKYVTVMQDGWKTRTAEPVIAHSVRVGTNCFFFNAISTEENKKTSRYCARLLNGALDNIKDSGGDPIAVVTDNCKSMEKMRKLVNEEYPAIFTYGCHAHLLNLIGRKLSPEDLMERVHNVHTFFRTHDVAAALLKKKRAPRPVMPSNTRWKAWLSVLEYYVKYQTKMLEVSRVAGANVPDDIIKTLNYGPFYQEVEISAKNLKPIQIAIDVVQKESSELADGVMQWLSFRDELDIRDAVVQTYFDKQFKRALQPVAIASHMLHPKHRGQRLDPVLIAKGNAFLAATSPRLVIVAAQLKLKNTDYFQPELFSEPLLKSCTSSDWWSSIGCLEKVASKDIELAMKLMQLWEIYLLNEEQDLD